MQGQSASASINRGRGKDSKTVIDQTATRSPCRLSWGAWNTASFIPDV